MQTEPDNTSTPSGQTAAQPSQEKKTNILAILSLVFSVIGMGIVGIILGFVGLSQIKKTGEGGKGLAIAGIIVGFFGVFLLFLLVVLSGIAYFGVLDAQTFESETIDSAMLISDRCTMTGGLVCREYHVSGEGVEFRLENNRGLNINNLEITLASETCGGTKQVGSLTNGASVLLSFDCSIPPGVFQGDIVATYTAEGSTIPQSGFGMVVSTLNR